MHSRALVLAVFRIASDVRERDFDRGSQSFKSLGWTNLYRLCYCVYLVQFRLLAAVGGYKAVIFLALQMIFLYGSQILTSII